MRSWLTAALILAATLGCASGGEESPMSEQARLETARGLAQSPPVQGVAPFHSAYEPDLGEPGFATPLTLSGESTKRISATVQAKVGPVDVSLVEYGYGAVSSDSIRMLPELGPEHELKEVFVDVRGAERCDALRTWLEETYGPPTAGSYWAGITTGLLFKWQSTGDKSTKACALWWTHWPPDEVPMAAYKGDAPDPGDASLPTIEDAQRAAYIAAWERGVGQILAGAAELEATVSGSGLDEAHQATLRAQLAALTAE